MNKLEKIIAVSLSMGIIAIYNQLAINIQNYYSHKNEKSESEIYNEMRPYLIKQQEKAMYDKAEEFVKEHPEFKVREKEGKY